MIEKSTMRKDSLWKQRLWEDTAVWVRVLYTGVIVFGAGLFLIVYDFGDFSKTIKAMDAARQQIHEQGKSAHLKNGRSEIHGQ